MGCEKDADDIRILCLGPAHERKSIFSGHLDVGEEDVDISFLHRSLCIGNGTDAQYRIDPVGKKRDTIQHSLNNFFMIIND